MTSLSSLQRLFRRSLPETATNVALSAGHRIASLMTKAKRSVIPCHSASVSDIEAASAFDIAFGQCPRITTAITAAD